MRTSLPSSFAKIVLCTLFALLVLSFATPVMADSGVTGAAFTTMPLDGSGNPLTPLDGTVLPSSFVVNANVQYPSKPYVFLNGGPRNDNGAGLTPTAPSPGAQYYFQVTDPSGKVLLSADPAVCRIVDVVTDSNGHGRVDGLDASVLSNSSCPTRLVFADPTRGNTDFPVQLCPPAPSNNGSVSDPGNWCENTPNNGGVYKAYLIRADNAQVDPNDPSGTHLIFSDKDSQTDNFKVKEQGTACPPEGCPGPPPASVSVCKFWDENADHLEDNGEPLLPGWTIDITNQDGGGTAGNAVTGSDISNFGCVMFSIGFAGGPTTTVSLNEVLQTNWNQTAPQDGTYSVSDGMGGNVDVTASGFVQTLTVAPGDVIQLNDFGNTGFDLTVSKTANPGFTRTYNWTITKDVDKTLIETTGTTATFNYTVVASQTGFTDSAFQVTGSITVNNPNTFDVAGVTVTENGDGVGTCTLDTNGLASLTGVTVPAGGSKSYTYTCTYASNPGSGINQASASWTAATYNTPDSSASNTASYAFGAPTNPVNKTITVTDTYWTNLPTPTTVTLGTCTANDATPFASCTFKYQRVITVKAGCFLYDNTATIKETGQTAKKEVEVCGPAATGALTMGFWQNKNGQGIITGQAKTGVCASGTWLRQYPPFQDLSSTATCAQVATYVYNVIKAATCSTGGTCNTMLKAQMLSTALDVYFSDSTLGGNKIGAPAAIGPVKIDLAHICSMIDGSGGTATCSGTFLNCSSAFGGATCLSVFDILTYAGSQSNAGGSVWYGQVKATQVLAKNVFDAINNRVAFNCP